jgi:hypothetical protein
MTDKRGRRAWIKVQLADKPEAHEAARLVKHWKEERQAARNTVKALRLYAALCRGDTSVLAAYFPDLPLSTAGQPVKPRSISPAPTVTVSHAPRSEAEELDEALEGIGLDGLDF